MIAVATLVNERFHPGLGALVNSLVASGFQGDVWVEHESSRPAWDSDETTMRRLAAAGISVRWREHSANGRALTYSKPDLVEHVFATDPAIEYVALFDSDIVVMRNWSFFAAWLRHDIAVCEDLAEFQVSATSPVRQAWHAVLTACGHIKRRDIDSYFNGGFVGVPRTATGFRSV